MTKISIYLSSDFLPSQINNIDILLLDMEDSTQNQFTIVNDFPDSLNLREGVKLTAFYKLVRRRDYNIRSRIFLNEAPYIFSPRNHILTFPRDGDNVDVTLRMVRT